MGDRCYVEITYEAEDDALLKEHLEFDKDEEFEQQEEVLGIIEGSDCDVNYGYYNQLQKAAAAGVVFIASNGAGSDYGPGYMLGFEGKSYYHGVTFDGGLAVEVSKDGNVSDSQMVAVREFLAIQAKIDARFEAVRQQHQEGAVV